MTNNSFFDVIILGGSYAGLSAAMALGRSLRSVLIIDNGKPCNRQTPYSHNFLTHDGVEPASIAALAKSQVLKYDTVRFIKGTASKGVKESGCFSISIETGQIYQARKILFATGIRDLLPVIEGITDCWGISVLHCPYCHGYEVRNKKIGVLGNGDSGYELTKLISNLTGDLTLFTNGRSLFTTEQRTKIADHHIRLEETEISHIINTNGYINHLKLKDGREEKLDALFARVGFTQHCDIPVELGCELDEQGFIRIDHFQRTSLAGLYAAGDNTTMIRSVANAIAAGNKAGAMINRELTEDLF